MVSSINNSIIFTSRQGIRKKITSNLEKRIVSIDSDNFVRIPTYKDLYPVSREIPKLEKYIFGYKAPNSKPLERYVGSTTKSAGLSTESGGYGGCWIKAAGDMPLSTKDVHTCAVLHLYNSYTDEHMLYHVYAQSKHNLTSVDSIKELISTEFPRFTHANILPGDQIATNSIVKNINTAVDELNPKVSKQYYHITTENPEVVAHRGKLTYLDNTEPDKMTFTEVKDQYNY